MFWLSRRPSKARMCLRLSAILGCALRSRGNIDGLTACQSSFVSAAMFPGAIASARGAHRRSGREYLRNNLRDRDSRKAHAVLESGRISLILTGQLDRDLCSRNLTIDHAWTQGQSERLPAPRPAARGGYRQQLHQIGAEGASIRRIPPCPKQAPTRAGEPKFKLLAASSKEVTEGVALATSFAKHRMIYSPGMRRTTAATQRDFRCWA